jgi:hypothetical protein
MRVLQLYITFVVITNIMHILSLMIEFNYNKNKYINIRT